MSLPTDLPDGSPFDAALLAAERAAAILRERILDGHLPPGSPLRDVALAAELGMSRNSLREGLRLLSAEGLVVHQKHKGAMVRTLSTVDIRDIYRVRRALELGAIEESATADPSMLRALEQAVRAEEQALTDGQRVVGTAGLRFHQALVALLGSEQIDRFFRTILAQLRLAFFAMPDEVDSHRPWIPQDREICELVLSGRREQAKSAVRRYLDESELMLLDAVHAAERQAVRSVTASTTLPAPIRSREV